jgi:hypothetical protein
MTGSDAKELRKVVEIEWVGARPATKYPKNIGTSSSGHVGMTDLVAGGGDLEVWKRQGSRTL